MTRAAVVRSGLHLQFLEANDAMPDVVFYREEWMGAAVDRAFPGKGVNLGREKRPGARILRWPDVFFANRAYYRSVSHLFSKFEVCDLIIFLEGEPLERFICQLPQIRSIELWEEGLSHYVDLTGPVWYAARGVVQAASGFFAKDIVKRRMPRSQFVVRDRFERCNLNLPRPRSGHEERNEFLLIGSPLVEDRIISRRQFVSGIEAVVAASPWPVRYLAHPREAPADAGLAVRACNAVFDANAQGLMKHVEQYEYRAYGAAISTGLLDMGRYGHSCYVPALFGLTRMARVLSGWSANPIPVIANVHDLQTRLVELHRNVSSDERGGQS